MKILYIATSFPEPKKGATIYTDLAEAMHDAGHDITVAVSEQKRNADVTVMSKERGFDVLRIVTGNYYDVGLIEKGITTLRIPSLMKKGISKHLGNRQFDFVLYEAPPVTNAGLVLWAKKKFKCKSYLMLKDIFPQNALDIGIMKRAGIIYRYFSKKEDKLYASADIIGCMSEANRRYVIEHNEWLSKDKVEIFPNTKKITVDYKSKSFVMRQKYNIPKEACVFLFGGNMGKPQYVGLLCEAVKKCKDEKDIFFLFAGRGTDRKLIEHTVEAENINNALVLDNLPRDEYEQITKECNVGLIILDPRFTIPNYPSRILSYMEYAKPVLAATDKVTDLKDLIEKAKCGYWTYSGDAEAFVEKIKTMAKDNDLEAIGENGRRYMEQNFNLERSVGILERNFSNETR